MTHPFVIKFSLITADGHRVTISPAQLDALRPLAPPAEKFNQDTFFKSVLDSIYDGVYFVDPERKITYWNKSAERRQASSPKKWSVATAMTTSCCIWTAREKNCAQMAARYRLCCGMELRARRKSISVIARDIECRWLFALRH